MVLKKIAAEAKGKLQMEAILLAQTFTGQAASSDGNRFDGGSFGGGEQVVNFKKVLVFANVMMVLLNRM